MYEIQPKALMQAAECISQNVKSTNKMKTCMSTMEHSVNIYRFPHLRNIEQYRNGY